MITYHYQTDFELKDASKYTNWIIECLQAYNCTCGPIAYIFCSDDALLQINKQHLNHDFYTDIITFQYQAAPEVSGDIYVSIDRVRENAKTYSESFEQELRRVMIHGILHLIGFRDGTDREKEEMRKREDELMEMFHVKH